MAEKSDVSVPRRCARQGGAALLIALCLGAVLAPPARARAAPTEPLWELVLAGAGGWSPDYPAAEQNHLQGIGAPFLIYRGKHLRAGDDNDVLRTRYRPNERLEFDLSLSGSMPTDSEKNAARAGMPDLGYVAEIGPRVRVTVSRLSADRRIDLLLPVRLILNTDLSDLGYSGVACIPELALQENDLWGTGAQVKLGVALTFGTAEYMDMFYGVAASQATEQREEYRAAAGYLGSKVNLFLSRRFWGRLSLYGSAYVGYYGGATNDQSPLFRRDFTLSAGCGVVWSVFQSETRVPKE